MKKCHHVSVALFTYMSSRLGPLVLPFRTFLCDSSVALNPPSLSQAHTLLRCILLSSGGLGFHLFPKPALVLRVNLHQTHINLVHVENSPASASAAYGPPIGFDLSRPLPFYGTELPGSTIDSAITIDAGKSLYIFPRVGVDGQHPVILSSEATLGLKERRASGALSLGR